MISNPKSKIQNPKSLRPPQFRLRTLLLLVTACAVLLALRQALGSVAVAAIAFLALSIFAHVAGNFLGTRLREIGDQPGEPSDAPTTSDRIRPRPQDFAPTTLGQRHSLGWTIIIATCIGITTGAIGGGFWTFLAARGHIGPMNIAVGVVAFAILGGLAAFATVAFTQVLFAAIWQAMKPVKHPD